jgi:hypothetical protein
VHRASHDSFADGPLLQPSLLPIPNQADQTIDLIKKYTVAFLDKTLKSIPSGLFAQSMEQAEISVRVFPTR